MAHPQRGNFAAALPPGETLASVRAAQVAFAAQQTGVSVASFRASQARAEVLRRAGPPVKIDIRSMRRPTGTVAVQKLQRLVAPTDESNAVVLFETRIEGSLIKLTATPPAGAI